MCLDDSTGSGMGLTAGVLPFVRNPAAGLVPPGIPDGGRGGAALASLAAILD